MNKEVAFDLVEKVCREFKGTAKDHEMLKEALGLLKPEPKTLGTEDK